MPSFSWNREHLIFVALTCLAVPNAWGDFFLHPWEDQYESKGATHFQVAEIYYSSSKNYDGIGQVFSPQGMGTYTRLETDVTLQHGLTERVSVFGRVTWAYVTQTGTIFPGNGYGLMDQSLGFNLRVFGKPSILLDPKSVPSFDLQLQGDFPGYSNSASQSSRTASLGDGTLDIALGGFLTFPVYHNEAGILSLVVGAAALYRSDNYSAAIPWSGSLQYAPWENGVFFKAMGMGLTSLNTDPNNGLKSAVRSSAGSGGSYITGDMNPSIFQLRGDLGYRFGQKTELFASATQSVWGQDSPNGFNILLLFQTHFGSVNTREKANPIFLAPRAYGKSNQGFLNYSLDARILKSNERMNLVKIDKGSQDGVEEGQIFDIFLVTKNGEATEAIARGKVTSLRVNEAALDIIEFYKEVWIEEGFTAKRLIQ